MDDRPDAGNHEKHRATQWIERQAERYGEDWRQIDPGNRGSGGGLLKKMRQAQTKLPRTAPTEINALAVGKGRVPTRMTIAETSGRSRAIQGNITIRLSFFSPAIDPLAKIHP